MLGNNLAVDQEKSAVFFEKKSVHMAICFLIAFVSPFVNLALFGANVQPSDLFMFFLASAGLILYKRIPLVSPAYWYGVLLFICGSLVSTFFSPSPLVSVTHVAQYALIFFFVIPLVYKLALLPHTFNAFAFGFSAASLIIVGDALVSSRSGAAQLVSGGRFGGIFGTPQIFSFTLISMLPFVVYLAYSFKNHVLARVVFGFLVLLILLGLLQAASRTALVAIFITSALAALIITVNVVRKAKSSKLVKFFLAGSVVIAAMVMFIYHQYTLGNLDLLIYRWQVKTMGGEDVRITDYIHVLDAIDLRVFMLGVGYNFSTMLTGSGFRVHNGLLIILTEAGVVTFIGLLVIFLAPLLAAVKLLTGADPCYRAGDSDQKKYGNLYAQLMASFTGVVMFVFITMFNTQTLHRLYWIIFAIMLAKIATAKWPRMSQQRQ